ncbi:MAG: hypothetical protein B7Y99_11525 [Caulobacterales bacterium 32-69-10]|nr:MAG: hypothetical protein B7Y99_11525 [Caulobacterales bacterium 32-69-10]
MQTAPSSGFRLTGRHVLFAVVGFFAVIIAVDGLFMALAIRSFPGQVSQTPFEDGLAYNRTLARREAQARLGYGAVAEERPGAVAVRMTRSGGAPLTGARLSGSLSRPATEAGRRAVTFREAAPGEYVAKAKGLTGAWDLALAAHDAEGRLFEAERRLMWPR